MIYSEVRSRAPTYLLTMVTKILCVSCHFFRCIFSTSLSARSVLHISQTLPITIISEENFCAGHSSSSQSSGEVSQVLSQCLLWEKVDQASSLAQLTRVRRESCGHEPFSSEQGAEESGPLRHLLRRWTEFWVSRFFTPNIRKPSSIPCLFYVSVCLSFRQSAGIYVGQS